MAKSGEQREALVSDETKEQIKAALAEAGDAIRQKVTEKAIEVVENLIVKLEEILAYLQPHPEPYAKEASSRLKTLIDELKQAKAEK